MASVFATIYDSLNFGNLILLLLLLLMLHHLIVLYEFRNMPPGPRLTTIPVLGNVFSLDFKAEKLTDAFQRSVKSTSIFHYLILVNFRADLFLKLSSCTNSFTPVRYQPN